MKRLFLIIACVILASPFSWATGQEGDVIVLDGEEWALLDAPLERLDSLTYYHLQDVLGWESHSTGNWRGYVAYWSVSDGMLFLEKVVKKDAVAVVEKVVDGIEYHFAEEVDIECDYDTVCRILERYVRNGKVCASWFSDNLIAGRGKIVRYIHSGFNRDHEEEIVVSVAQGKVSLSQVFHNRRGLGPEEDNRLNTYLKAFPTDGYGLEKGQYLFRFKYDAESGKWIAKLHQPPPLLKAQEALEKDFTDYLNAYDGELRDYIRGEWTSSRVFRFPFVL
ncbi:MAG: hypothetical protein IJ714_03830 [Bacteroidales bacterium]|nr:hypothetical protein [Bacteroidales bacterium]